MTNLVEYVESLGKKCNEASFHGNLNDGRQLLQGPAVPLDGRHRPCDLCYGGGVPQRGQEPRAQTV